MVNLNRSLTFVIALATCITAIPASAKTDPRAVAFGAVGTYVALGCLHSLTKTPLICEADPYDDEQETTSDKVIDQTNRILEKACSSLLLYMSAGLAIVSGRDRVPGDASKASAAGALVGALTICSGYSLLKSQPSLICKTNKPYEKNSRTLRQVNRILGKFGALGLIVLGGLMVAQPIN